MPKFIVKNKAGEEFDFDPVEYAVSQDPSLKSAKLAGYDSASRTFHAKTKSEDLELKVDDLVKGLGLELVGGAGDAPEVAMDSSPLSMTDRMRLGLSSSEAGEAARLFGAVAKTGATAELDARAEANQGRALKFLKSKFEDARIVDGEYVVQQGGVWHKADAPGVSAGDIAQFAAANGLNILGSIAGGAIGAVGGTFAAPGPGTVAGAAAGSAAGAGLAEGAEELIRAAVERDAIDVKGTAFDMLTEGVLGLVGSATEAGVRVAAPAVKAGAKALVPEAVEKSAAATVKGLKAFAKEADGKVKDAMAATFAALGPGISKGPLRQVLDSPETVQEALAVGKAAMQSDEARNGVLNTMTDIMQEAVDKVQTANQDKYGEVVEAVTKAADDSIELNLDDTVEQLEKLLKGASPEKRNFLDPVITKAKEMIAASRPNKAPSVLLDANGQPIRQGVEPVTFRGAKAVRALHSLKMSTTEKLGKLGAFNKASVDSLTDADTLRTAMDMEDLLDSKILSAADRLNLGDDVAKARQLYGATKDQLKVLRGKVFSEKRPISNVVKMAREEMGEDVSGAIIELQRLHPETNIVGSFKKVQLMQGGLETAPRWLPTKDSAMKLVAGAGVGAVTGNPLMATVAGAAAGSPRTAGFLARNLTSSGGAAQTVGKAANLIGGSAEVTAKMLTRLAASSGFLHTLPRLGAQELLKNPDSFNQFLEKSGALVDSSATDTEENVTNAAIRKVQQGGK